MFGVIVLYSGIGMFVCIMMMLEEPKWIKRIFYMSISFLFLSVPVLTFLLQELPENCLRYDNDCLVDHISESKE